MRGEKVLVRFLINERNTALDPSIVSEKDLRNGVVCFEKGHIYSLPLAIGNAYVRRGVAVFLKPGEEVTANREQGVLAVQLSASRGITDRRDDAMVVKRQEEVTKEEVNAFGDQDEYGFGEGI